MSLSNFIRQHLDDILNEWEQFAASIPSASGFDTAALRDDAKQILLSIAADMEAEQSEEEQRRKSQGRQSDQAGQGDTAAQAHGGTRFSEGFNLDEMVSEYRALRASVIQLWLKTSPVPEQRALYELTRFNEGIDQALTESIARYAQRLNRSRELFMGMLGHDLRTPIQVILHSSAHLLRAGTRVEVARKMGSYIEQSAQHLNTLIGDLLDVARTRFGESLPLTPMQLDAEAVCRQVIDDFKTFNPDRDIRYERQGDLTGEWDGTRLQQLLANLVRNALQHGAPSEPVTLRAVGETESVRLSVHNLGVPIPASILPHIFEPLTHGKAEGAPERTGSLGLGLYIACEIAKAHGGNLEVESSAEHGTLFTTTLPRHVTAVSAGRQLN